MTVEELRSMTHEDLVRRVQELEEANEILAEEKNTWYKSWSDLKQKFDHFKNAVKSIVLIIDLIFVFYIVFVLGVPSVRIVHLF